MVFATLPFLALALLAVALGYVRLRHGPISLAFLAAPIERSINAELSGYAAKIGDAIVRLTESGRLEFRLAEVSFQESDGDTVASAPLAAVELSHKALLQGKLVPSRVELIEPRLFLAYAPDTGLSMSFSAPAEVPAPRPARPVGEEGARTPPPAGGDRAAPRPAPPGAQQVNGDAPQLKQIDAGALLRRVTASTRGSAATSFLREFGLRDATVVVDHDGAETIWRLPEFTVDLDHRGERSVISGQASVSSNSGFWQLAFHTEDSHGVLALNASVRGLVPSAFTAPGGPLPFLSRIDLPIGADVSIDIGESGAIAGVEAAIELGKGRIILASREHDRTPIDIDAGLVKLDYDAAAGTLDLRPSTLKFGPSSLTLGGKATRRGDGKGSDWTYELQSLGGVMAAPELGAAPVAIDQLRLTGVWSPRRDAIDIEALEVKAGGTGYRLDGTISTDASRPGVRLGATVQPAPLDVVKSLWPPFIAPMTRTWIARHVDSGSLRSLRWTMSSGIHLDPGKTAGRGDEHSLLVVETGPVVMRTDLALPPISAQRALVQIENDALELTVPEAVMALPSGKPIAVKTVRMTSPDLMHHPAVATISFRALSDAAPAVELLAHPGLAVIKPIDTEKLKLQGKVDANISLTLPLIKSLARSQIAIAGTAKLTDGKASKAFGGFDVQGATIDVDLANGAVEVKGGALIAGVPTRIGWQRILNATGDQQQPPLRVTATLDNADRTQLGLDINHMLHGEVPVDIQIAPAADDWKVKLRADLSNAELILGAVSWAKPPGRSAFAEFDIVPTGNNRHELQGFRVAGDDIAIEGSASIGADGKLREFSFPVFSLNLVTRLAVKGTRSANGVWSIKANGPTFDGKDFFRALFSVGRVSDRQDAPDSRDPGIDLEAEIDTVLGFSQVSLRELRMSLSQRAGKLAKLEAKGTLDGGAPLVVKLDHDGTGNRRLRADSTDAGQAFKLTGFYPNVQAGRVRLEVNVDGSGAAEKTGTLLVEDFRVLGDAVVAEVVSSVDEGRPPISGGNSARTGSGRRVVRQVFDFDRMNVPFSVGHGQFVMQDAYVRGPLLGATIRGKVDYKYERMSLGGTYIPLQGLNNAFGQIPVLGQILSGPRGEGIFGITFAIQGAMASPEVIVNPLSLVAPGIFREVFQMTNPTPTVQPRKIDAKPSGPTARSSSAPAVTGSETPSAPGTTIDGWSSETRRR
ncbi:MAG: AsmA-like C-terminal region-containing protein [Hyphomicrobiaceae bacterium]